MHDLLWRRGSAALVAAALLLVPQAAHAWGETGHRIVGQGAEDALSDTARAALREIAGPRTLAMLATWPDFVRSDKAWDFVSRWHYVTVEDGDTLAEVLERSAVTIEPDNLVEAIGYLVALLEGDKKRRRNFQQLLDDNRCTPLGGSLDLTAIALLAHFVGDVHQPLHVGRGDDWGGNAITVNFFGEVEKLHSVWDSGIIDRQRLSFTEFSRFLAADLGGRVDPGEGGPEVWAQESLDYRHRLYQIWSRTSRENYLPDLGYDYVFAHLSTIQRRLYLGGLRLAELLNAIYE